MSIDKSLRLSSRMRRHRNVLTRIERIERLTEEERWNDGDSVFGLPKVRIARARARGKAPKQEEAEAVLGTAAEGTEEADGAAATE